MRDVHFHGCYIGYYFSNVWQVVLDQLHAHGGGAEQNAIGFWGAEVDPSNQNNAVIATGCVAQDVSLYYRPHANGQVHVLRSWNYTYCPTQQRGLRS